MMYLSSPAECWYTGRPLWVISVINSYSPRLSGYNSPAGPELLTLTMSGMTCSSSVIVYLIEKYSPQYITGNNESTEIQRKCCFQEFWNGSYVQAMIIRKFFFIKFTFFFPCFSSEFSCFLLSGKKVRIKNIVDYVPLTPVEFLSSSLVKFSPDVTVYPSTQFVKTFFD